eukprot:TRINITY_DN5151_c0_g1_i2.p2 TRINITY_DN5151_c0_g1~~TRINITY_DN5151_c0_g1_i2.p2  ORF type:complete len:118 (-),score=23.16 TRINITY_DN5151_c0_g1_i2:117-470(-)
MKFSLALLTVLLVSLASGLPKDRSDQGSIRQVFGGIKDTITGSAIKNVNQLCTGTGGGTLVDSCPKPFEYCDTSASLSTRCRYRGFTWALIIGGPLVGVALIVVAIVLISRRGSSSG